MTDIKFGVSTDIGLVRDINEDSRLAEPPLFAVADGMGGHMAGDVASKMVIETLNKGVLGDSDALAAAVRDANMAVYEAAAADPALKGMGTTLTALYAGDSSVQLVHVGDSRGYLFRDGELKQITSDHTVVGRLVAQGRIDPEEAKSHPQRSMLERALGVDPDVEIDVEVLDAQPGDRFLLCSDGLTGLIDDEQILEILDSESDPQRAANLLCESAVRAGGHDNVTAVVVDYPGPRKRAVKPAHMAAAPRGRRGKRAVAAVLVILLLVLGGLWLRATVNSSWFVGEDGGRVAIFKGLPGSFAGINLSSIEERTDLETDSLPDVFRERVKEGTYRADSPEEARAIVSNLRQVAGELTPKPSLSPGVTPTATTSP